MIRLCDAVGVLSYCEESGKFYVYVWGFLFCVWFGVTVIPFRWLAYIPGFVPGWSTEVKE